MWDPELLTNQHVSRPPPVLFLPLTVGQQRSGLNKAGLAQHAQRTQNEPETNIINHCSGLTDGYKIFIS